MATFPEMIISNNYADIILDSYQSTRPELQDLDPESGRLLPINSQYSILYYTRAKLPRNLFDLFSYNSIPRLYTTLDTTALEVSGILQIQNQPLLNLTGRGVLIGVIDTGIDYTHPAFLDASGRSRILRIWDQSIQTVPERHPSTFPYGAEYTKEDINRALASPTPYNLVPSRDEIGHGTAVAGIAGGSESLQNQFIGAAPNAEFLIVKLKETKPYLKELYRIATDTPAYSENDILTGLSYLSSVAGSEQKPLILCLALGSNQGGHSGRIPLSASLNRFSQFMGQVPVVACGNESGKAHHYYGSAPDVNTPASVELLVPDGSYGFSCELWGQVPQIFSVSFRTPLGEFYSRIPVTLQRNDRISFVLESTVIEVTYDLAQSSSGNQLILMRFFDPTPGIWTIQVYPNRTATLDFHMWLPITDFNRPDVRFLTPNPYTTLTTPSPSEGVISTAAYDGFNNSLLIHSGRGYTVTGAIKPDFAAPGVMVTAPGPGRTYLPFSGTSASAAITAGACALLMEWGLTRNPPFYFTADQIKIYLIRGCDQVRERTFPNREWGYGTLDLYQTFLSLTSF